VTGHAQLGQAPSAPVVGMTQTRLAWGPEVILARGRSIVWITDDEWQYTTALGARTPVAPSELNRTCQRYQRDGTTRRVWGKTVEGNCPAWRARWKTSDGYRVYGSTPSAGWRLHLEVLIRVTSGPPAPSVVVRLYGLAASHTLAQLTRAFSQAATESVAWGGHDSSSLAIVTLAAPDRPGIDMDRRGADRVLAPCLSWRWPDEVKRSTPELTSHLSQWVDAWRS